MTTYERAAQIWPLLAYAASNRAVLTYDIVGKLIGVPRHGLARLLEPIQCHCIENKLPALTSIVVSGQSGLPGTGFIATSDISAEHQKVFAHDWLSEDVPDSNGFEKAYRSWNSKEKRAH